MKQQVQREQEPGWQAFKASGKPWKYCPCSACTERRKDCLCGACTAWREENIIGVAAAVESNALAASAACSHSSTQVSTRAVLLHCTLSFKLKNVL